MPVDEEVRKGEDGHQCPRCNNRVGDLKRHIQGVHEDQRPFKCNFPKCEWAFSRKETLERHARIKHGLNPLLCIDCGKNCASRHALNLHWNIKHANPPVNFPCKFCGEVLKHSTARWAHERFHTHCRCPIRFCKKFFKTAEEALAHVRGPDHGHEDDFTEGDLHNLNNPVASQQDA